jgi:hypothetical protein
MRMKAAALALLLAGCGPKAVQLYEGPKLPNDQVQYLWSNPRLIINVDRQYTIPEGERDSLQRMEVQLGNHAVEVQCLYDDANIKVSPSFALLLDGKPGHAYKPRVHFERNPAGLPACHAKLFDVTDDPGGQKVDLY